MAPKAAKKGAAAKKTAAAQGPEVQTWESGLANAHFDEEHWQACVCVLVGRGPHEEELIRVLARAVQQPQRKLFSSLSWEDTEAKIREYGNPKAKKRDAFPQYYEVTEPARELLEAREEISAELMAQIVKFMLLQIKENDQQRRKAEIAAAVPPSTKEKAGPKGKDKKSKEEPPAKPKTKLKRRDDVEPPEYIDDEPTDGPQHYVLLLGFHQPHLAGTLDAAGVHVANVVGLSAAHLPCDEHPEPQEENSEANADEIAAREATAAQAKTLDRFWATLRQVLDDGGPNSRLHNVAQLEYAVPDSLMPFDPQDPDAAMAVATQLFDGVANLIYDCLDWRRQHQHYLDTANFIRVPSVVSGQDSPQPAETGATVSPRSKKSGRPPPPKKAPSSLTTDVDMNHYNGLMEHVPAEACSVPLILHCMLEQVVMSSEQSLQSHVPDDPGPQTAPGLDHHVVAQMLHSVLPQVETEDEGRDLLYSLLTTVQREEDKEMLMEQFDAEETPKRSEQPVIIRHHDERALRLIGITETQGLDPAQEEASMMKRSPAWKLINSVAQRRSNSSCWRAIKQQLQRQCTDDEVSWPQAERFFHQSVFESMLLTGLDENGILGKDCRPLGMVQQTKKHPVNPWDNPLSFAKLKLRNLRKKCPTFLRDASASTEQTSERQAVQLDLSDIQSCRLRSLSDWRYAEHFEAAVFPQVLRSAAQQFRCLDTLRGSHNNVMYIFCHNPMSSDRLCKEFWDVALHTDVKFRTYLEHVADTIADWIEKEELKRQLLDVNRTSSAHASENWTEEDEEPRGPFITKNSLKASRLEEERLKDEEAKKGKKPAKGAPGKKQQAEDAKSAEAKKSDKSAATGGKSKATTDSSATAASDRSLSSKADDKEEAASGFAGFHMEGMLVHLSGCLQYVFPAAGGHVTVETVGYVEGSSMLKVAVRKDGHHFYTHISQVSHAAKNDVKENPAKTTAATGRSFSALLDNGVRLSYGFRRPPEKCKVESVNETERGPQESTGAELTDTPKTDGGPAEAQACEGQSRASPGPFNSLNLSVPSGLLVQFMREDEEQDMLVRLSFHVAGRQHPRLAKEASRTVTGQGAVIRYMRDGSSEVNTAARFAVVVPAHLISLFMLALQVLFADGAISSSSDSGPVWLQEVEEDITDEQNPEKQITSPPRGFWTTTTPRGTRIVTVGSTHERSPGCSLLTYKTSDPVTQETMLSREDLVVTVRKPDGSVSVDHADGTRITTFYRERPPSADDDVGIGVTGRDGHAPGEAATKNAKTHESASAPSKERVVLVENEACATVLMYPERHLAEIWLADGTVITGDNEGDYQVVPSSVGLLHIQSDGKCVYSSGRVRGGLPSYVMSHTDNVACDITDVDGNRFQVSDDGQVTAHNVGPAPRTLQEVDEDEDEDKDTMSKPREHRPRLFLVHEDGSGSELLSSQAVVELLRRAHSDPTAVLLKDPLPDTRGDFGITVLKPSIESARSRWMHAKLDPDLLPQTLRNRSGRDSPRFEAPDSQAGSPSFATTTAPGLQKRSVAGVAVRSCPKVLEIRELYQRRPLSRRLKNVVDMRLKEYIESLMEKAQRSADVMLKEPRAEAERVLAGVLLSQSLTEEAHEARTIAKRTPGDMGSLYSQAVRAPVEPLDDSEDPATMSSVGCARVKESKWTDTLEQYREELFEVKACVDALRKKFIVPYFHPENISLHQSLLLPGSPDMRRPILTMSDDTAEAFERDDLQEEQHVIVAPPPSNQTPHSASHTAARSSRVPGTSPPTAAAPSLRTDSSGPLRSGRANVSGRPGRPSVRLPPSIVSSKPFSVPNRHFRSVEEPVRRRCRTISLADPNTITRGFELRPSSVDFGLRRDGTHSAVTVVMKNVGVDTCRFHVKQPPISSGLRVKYHPGPVPAGLRVQLKIELFAMCDAHEGYTDPAKYISQDIVIPTETDIIFLPVTATVLPESLHDVWLRDGPGRCSGRPSGAPEESRKPASSRGPASAAGAWHHTRTASL
ncbi:sperm-associated antigen 17 isoform X3 [Phyllopteryx taeniolatus]|uniref:sperm-associated antigen 17 isoform X3 n=1 Tax=Phyllopteryx taeniolatus TaxID=161469 RepID=UPI002AD4C6D3|nr:sperm-associated antigen 17 isoform X3 [Phyllopteryx taeniolatus]